MGTSLIVGVISFCLGIIAGSLVHISWPIVAFLFLLGVLFLIFSYLVRQRLFIFLTLAFIFLSLGTLRMQVVERTLPEPFEALLETNVTLSGTVVLDPDRRENSQRLTIETEQGNEKTRVLVVAPVYPSVRFGETVQVRGVLTRPEAFQTDGGRVFRYDQFLEKDGVFSTLSPASIEQVTPRAGIYNEVRGTLSDIKFFGIDALQNALPEPHASLASGLILGGKQGLGENLLDDFTTTGLIHIVVLSGYNVMVVAEFVLRVFQLFSRRFATIAAASTIGLFVLVAGAGAASIRAGLMASIALYGRATGRTYSAFRALIAVGLLMVFWNPLVLTFDPGFQLSFVATLGLIFGTPIIEKQLLFITNGLFRELLAATLAAQIAVLPLLLYQNGLFSLVSVPANLLVLLVVPLSMLLSLIALIGGVVVPLFAPVLGIPAYALLSYIIGVVELLASLPLSSFTIPPFPFFLVALSYALLGWWVWRATPQHVRDALQGHSR